LERRVETLRVVGPAVLPDHVLRWDKRGSDGSGKCSVLRAPGEGPVRGILYDLSPEGKAALDRVEGLGSGYREAVVTVETDRGSREAVTYVAQEGYVDDGLRPFDWYRDLVVEGARSWGFPRSYVDALARVEVAADPDGDRARRHGGDLPCVGVIRP
jgi:hypothetical protein